MTPNNPSSIQPENVSPEEGVENLVPQKGRPSPKNVSPSQHGRFLGAMEGEEKKPVKKPTSGLQQAEEPEESSGEDIFRLSSVKGLKKEGQTGEALESETEPETTPQLPESPKLLKGQTAKTVVPSTAKIPVKQVKATPEKLEERPYTPRRPTKEQEFVAGQAVAGQEAARTIQVGPTVAKESAPTTQRIQKPSETADTSLPDTSRKPTAPAPVPLFSAMPQAAVVEKPTPQTATTVRATILEIVQQTVQALEVLRAKDESTITVTIQRPPLFAGATFKIVESTAAKNEFNITFDNLTPEARRVIETQANQVQLHQALLDKGYTLRNIVIAPEIKFGPTMTTVLPTSPGEQQSREGQRDSSEGFGQEESFGGRKR